MELVLGVLQTLLGVGRTACGLHRALRLRNRATRHVGDCGHAGRDSVRARQVERFGLAAQLLDATLELTRVALRLLQVLLEALLVGGRLGQLNVQGKRSLELLLLAIGLIEPLDYLRVPGVYFCH